jgi:hypothetical protein
MALPLPDTAMTRYQLLRRRSLYSFIGFLALSAVLAVVAVLWGDMGWLEARVLITTLTISGVSIDSMGCAAYLERKGQDWMPLAGIGLALASGVLVILGAWTDIGSPDYWKFTAILATFAVACTHASLLALAELPPTQRWVYQLAQMAIFVVATLVTIALLTQVAMVGYYKLLVSITILVALLTLIIPILSRLAGNSAIPILVLTPLDNGLYRAADGRVYRLLPVDDFESAPPHGLEQ